MPIGPKYTKQQVNDVAKIGLAHYRRAIESGVDPVEARRRTYRRMERESSDKFFVAAAARRFRHLLAEHLSAEKRERES